MERKSGIIRFLLALIAILVIAQSWILMNQNKHLIKHLDKIASRKIIIKDGKIYDEEGNILETQFQKHGITETASGQTQGFADVEKLMADAASYKFGIGKIGGSFNYAVTEDPKTFNLILNREATTSDLLRYAYDPLIRENYITGDWEGVLAESWEMSEDGLECIMHLRKDIKFFDGVKMTADDVLFSFNDLLNNKNIDVGSKGALIFRDWDSNTKKMVEQEMKVEKIDDYTVRFIFPWKTYSSLSKINAMIYPKHILKKYVDNGTFNTTWDVSTNPKEIIGTGPWMPYEYFPGERFVMVRNPEYWLKDSSGKSLPYIEKINFNIIQDRNTQILKFKGGEIDFMSVGGSEISMLLEVPEKERDYKIFGTGPDTAIRYMAFNMNRGKDPRTGKPYVEPYKLEWFTNLQFRKAMAHCLDKKQWINNFMNGFGVPLWSPLSPASTEFCYPEVTTYPFDLDKAGKLLDEIQYIDRNNDGIREDPSGHPIEFTILTSARDEKALRPINMFISDLKKVGVKANYSIQETNSFYDRLWQTYEFECTFIGELAGFEVGGIRGLFASWESYRFYKPNYTESGNPIKENIEARDPWEDEIDRLFVEYDKELDREKRKEIGFRIQKVLSDNIPVIYTVVSENIYAIRDKYENLNPTVRFYPVIWPMMEYLYETK